MRDSATLKRDHDDYPQALVIFKKKNYLEQSQYTIEAFDT